MKLNKKAHSKKFKKQNNADFILCWSTTPGPGVCPGVQEIFPVTLLIFFSQKVSIAKSILVRGGTRCPLPHLSIVTLSGLSLSGPVHAATVSELMCASCVWKTHSFLGAPHHPLAQEPWALRGRVWRRHPIWDWVQSLSLCALSSCESVC